MEINSEFLLLLISFSVVILSFMVSMNAPGGRRMAISFLFSSLLLGVNVLVGLEYYGNYKKTQQTELFQNQFKTTKLDLKEKLETKNDNINRENSKIKQKEIMLINKIINEAIQHNVTLLKSNPKSSRYTYEQHISNSRKFYNIILSFVSESKKSISNSSIDSNILNKINESLIKLEDGAYSYKKYFVSGTTLEEQSRAREMKSNAQKSKESLMSARKSLDKL